MNKMLLTRRWWMLAAILLTVLSVQLPAQDKNIRTIFMVKVKPDRGGDWRAAAKDFTALKKKAGSEEYYTIWSSETGPDQYAVVWYSAKWKEFDEEQDPKTKDVAGELARIISRLNGASESYETWIDVVQPDLTFRSGAIPKMVRTSRTRVAADKMDAVLAVFKSDLMPAMKNSGLGTFGVATASYGTAVNEIHTFASMNAWEDFDSPWGAEKALGADGYKAFLAKVRPNVVATQFDVWRYQPVLSYQPEAK